MTSKYTACLKIAKSLEPLYGQDKNTDILITFSLGNAIFRCPAVHTGHSTRSAQYLPKTSKLTTFEHIFSRKQSAISIIKCIRRGWSDKRLETLIKSRCRVTVTLRTENQLLIPYQQNAERHPRATYTAAGLTWVKWWGNKIYTIEKKLYHVYDRHLILKEYNIPNNQLSYRISSKSLKWKNWGYNNVS